MFVNDITSSVLKISDFEEVAITKPKFCTQFWHGLHKYSGFHISIFDPNLLHDFAPIAQRYVGESFPFKIALTFGISNSRSEQRG